MRKTLFILFILLLNIAFSQAIYFRHLTLKDELSQLSVMSIYQDEIGRMWFGTLEGLCMYDGEQITIHKPESTNETGILGNDNRYIVGDRQGNIYFNSDFSFIKYNICTQQFKCLKKENVDAITSYNNAIYLAVKDTIYIFSKRYHLYI
ncbi:MAG: hypothetical protein LIO97_03025 [Tannerellaceae bacterium]|nr:hypothetical protein [Tannerellaceae bacterium]